MCIAYKSIRRNENKTLLLSIPNKMLSKSSSTFVNCVFRYGTKKCVGKNNCLKYFQKKKTILTNKYFSTRLVVLLTCVVQIPIYAVN